MMSLFGGSAVGSAATSDLQSMIPMTVVRQVIQEIADERSKNLAFRQAVSEHESSSLANAKVDVPGRPKARLGGRGGGGGAGGASSMTPANRRDLKVKPPDNRRVPTKVPRTIANQMVWDVVRVDGQANAINGALGEINYSPSLNTHPQSASWRALFDQWMIPQFSISYWSEQPPGDLNLPASVYTALDYDSSNALASITLVEDYSTCQRNVLSPGVKFVRSVRPCVKLDGPGTSGSALDRLWIDSAQPATPWDGIRTILASTAAVTQYLNFTVTIYYAFRNQI
jgi:hypothetical protein